MPIKMDNAGAMVKTAVDATYDLQEMLNPVAAEEERDIQTVNNQFKIKNFPI